MKSGTDETCRPSNLIYYLLSVMYLV